MDDLSDPGTFFGKWICEDGTKEEAGLSERMAIEGNWKEGDAEADAGQW